MKVVLVSDDIDRHGAGCECGVCNSSTGRSFGVGIFPVENSDLEDGDELQDRLFRCDIDPQERVYSPTAEGAFDIARGICQQNSWDIAEEEVWYS